MDSKRHKTKYLVRHEQTHTHREAIKYRLSRRHPADGAVENLLEEVTAPNPRLDSAFDDYNTLEMDSAPENCEDLPVDADN